MKVPGSFRPAAGSEHLYSHCNFAESLVETVPKSLRHSCRSELHLIPLFPVGQTMPSPCIRMRGPAFCGAHRFTCCQVGDAASPFGSVVTGSCLSAEDFPRHYPQHHLFGLRRYERVFIQEIALLAGSSIYPTRNFAGSVTTSRTEVREWVGSFLPTSLRRRRVRTISSPRDSRWLAYGL